MQKIWRQDWLKILGIYLMWLHLVFGAAHFFTRGQILPFTPSYLLHERLEAMPVPKAWRRLGGFDGVHYLTLVESGYHLAAGTQAFFPLYPLLVRGVNTVIRQPVVSGILVAVTCNFGFLLGSFWLVREKFSRKIAWWWTLIYLFSPASFFLVSFYSESLFLLLLMATFWAYERKKMGLVALFGALASATRIIGVIAPGAICLDYLYKAWKKRQWQQKKTWVGVGLISLGSLGLASFMMYLGREFGDPFYFMSVQSAFGAGRETSQLVMLPQVLWRYGKMFYHGLPQSMMAWTIVQELTISLIYLGGLMMTARENWKSKKEVFPWSWWWFSLGAWIVPTLTGNLSSMPRYVLPCLVVAAWWAKLSSKNPRLGTAIMIISGGAMLFNLLLFAQGFWVA